MEYNNNNIFIVQPGIWLLGIECGIIIPINVRIFRGKNYTHTTLVVGNFPIQTLVAK
jgi:hypothetical protein